MFCSTARATSCGARRERKAAGRKGEETGRKTKRVRQRERKRERERERERERTEE
jgi:hypothetical protein